MKITLVQCSPRVGDVTGNAALVKRYVDQLGDVTDLLVFPELMLTGYPPEDLLLLPDMMQRLEHALAAVAAMSCHGPAILLGHPMPEDGVLYNSLSVFAGGQRIFCYHKQYLPNYGVFDERRYFARGSKAQRCTFRLNGQRLGVAICEDLWHDDFMAAMPGQQADVWLSINASPFHAGKQAQRLQRCRLLAAHGGVPVAYVNIVGGQDELVFDGGSMVVDQRGLLMHADGFREDVLSFSPAALADIAPRSLDRDALADMHQALLLGLRDYVRGNGGQQVLLGLSGGIDSALVAALAAEALGPEAVLGVMLPSVFSSEHSLSDARETARLLGIRHAVVPITDVVDASMQQLSPLFAELGCSPQPGVCEENVQARSRGLLLMAISNKTGRMLLTTGNKSEMAVGYATLYGDMCGAFAVIKDVYKTEVFALARWMNDRSMRLHGRLCIPQHSIDKPPSAELAPGQQDSDTLPDYDDLDCMLRGLIEEHASVDVIAARHGFAREEVARVEAMLHRNEYKRRQAPPGVKVSTCAFGRERRFPMTHRYRSGD